MTNQFGHNLHIGKRKVLRTNQKILHHHLLKKALIIPLIGIDIQGGTDPPQLTVGPEPLNENELTALF